MSTTEDLSSAFGRPARNLSTLLTPNPRRSRREDGDEPELRAVADPEAGPEADATAGETAPGGNDVSTPSEQEPAREPTPSREPASSGNGVSTPSEPTPSRELASSGNGVSTLVPSAGEPTTGEPTTGKPTTGKTGERRRERATPAAETAQATQTTRAGGERQGAGRPRRGAPARPAEPRPSGTVLDPDTSYQVGVYVHPHAKTAAVGQRKTRNVTNAEVVFDAVDAVQHRLDGLIRERRLRARPDSSLFPGRVQRGRLAGGGAVAAHGEARRVLWQFRASGAELEVIDRLVERSGAESRSELVAVALETTLLS